MAYTNAIFHLDHYNGNDANRTALTSCIASNPSGTITRITKTGHGLVTGAVVTLSAFTAWLNGKWKITVVDANSFDLDDAVWQATADANGTVTPVGGSSWADAWKTYTNGVTAARVLSGDKIKVCKSPNPVSIGNATWTNGGKEITLAAPLTKNITDCETNWVPSANVNQLLVTSPRKMGSFAMKFSFTSAFTTGKVAYLTLPATLDLSAYQELCMWLYDHYTMIEGRFSIKLCSDATGDVAVDEFIIYKYMNSHLTAYNLPRIGGGNLGSNINSIALYANTDPGSTYVLLDNIFASTTGGLNLTSLISKNGSAQGGTETFFYIDYIDETTIGLARHPETIGHSWEGYPGITETVETFMREPYIFFAPTTNASQILNTLNSDGLEFEFGYDTTTGLLSGETFYSTRNGQSNFMQLRNGTKFSGYVSFAGYFYCLSNTGDITNMDIRVRSFISIGYSCFYLSSVGKSYLEVERAVGAYSVFDLNQCFLNTLKIGYCYSHSVESVVRFVASDHNQFYFTLIENPQIYSIYFAGNNNRIYGGSIIPKDTNTTSGRVRCNYGTNSIFDTRLDSAKPTYFDDRDTDAALHWINRDGAGSHEVHKKYSLMKWQTTEKYQGEPGALQIEIPTSWIHFTEKTPQVRDICEISFDAGSQVSITVPIKKSHLAVKVQLVVVKNPIVGINDDIKTILDENTDWQLLNVQFTPTVKGVIKLQVYYWMIYQSSMPTVYAYVGKPVATQE